MECIIFVSVVLSIIVKSYKINCFFIDHTIEHKIYTTNNCIRIVRRS